MNALIATGEHPRMTLPVMKKRGKGTEKVMMIRQSDMFKSKLWCFKLLKNSIFSEKPIL
jgi:hypothetical protein